MIAWLQRLLLLAATGASGLWAAGCVRAGYPQHALDLALAIVAAVACVFALEFLLMTAQARLRPGPQAHGIGELAAAWVGELQASARTFLWRQPFASTRWPDQVAPLHQGRRGVVFVHGYFCNRGFWNSWLRRLTNDGTPFIAVTLEPAFGSISAYAAAIEAAVATLHSRTGLAPVVVAHSMGGLAVRHWWATCAGATPQVQPQERLLRLLTLGTPHHGTWLARWAFTTNGRQMRLASSWLRELAASEPKAHRERTTCFYSRCDNIVFPAETAVLDGALNIRLDRVAHVAMAARPEPYAELQRLLSHPGNAG